MKFIVSFLPVFFLVGCVHGVGETETDKITGEVDYIETAPVSEGDRLEIILEDISRADAPAKRIAETVINDPGQPPHQFVLHYDAEAIDARHTYRVAARVYDGDDLLFVTDEIEQVLTRGFSAEANLRLRPIQDETPPDLGKLPATFSGTLPSAGPGVDVQINLLKDGVFFMSESYKARDGGPHYDRGRYLISSDGKILSLHGGREAPRWFSIESSDTLEMLDQEGKKIESELNYAISRQPEFQPMESRGLIGGQYSYLAGAGRFRECLTGLVMPVATEADNRALEEAYLEVRKEPGEEVRVSLEGQIIHQLPMEGSGPVRTIVPERVIGVWREQPCAPQAASAELEHTYWRLTLLDGDFVRAVPNQREPHLVFRDDGRVTGSDGCNRILGAFETEDASIGFSKLVTTRKACPDGMARGQKFVELLEAVDSYRIVEQFLEMLDADRDLLMRFEAVALH